MAEIPESGRIVNHGDVRDFRTGVIHATETPDVLRETSGMTLLATLGVQKSSGRLFYRDTGGSIEIHVQGGMAIRVEVPDVPFESLIARWLTEQGIASQEVQEKSRTRHPGAPLLQALYQDGICGAEDLVGALRSIREDLLGRFAAPGSATYSWAAGTPPRRPDPVGVDLVLFAANSLRTMTRTAYSQDLDGILSPFLGRYVFPSPRMTPALVRAILQEKERLVIEQVVDGTSTLKEAISQSLLTRIQTSRLFLLCTFLGLLEFREQGLPKGGIEQLEKELKTELERMKSVDFFQRLGLHWTTHPRHYDDAWRKMASRYGPESPVRGYSPRCAELAAQLYDLCQEAYRTLSDPAARRVYRVDRLGPEVLRFGCDFLYKQAHISAFREDWDLALETIESALDVVERPDFVELRRQILQRRVTS
ncbi:MAG TPA: hypothetical protein PLQ97_02270 [Myxococcota bacterium]|nr:hypothetical protein [Myxococcota bacterium]HQK50285.1 hypothetical protein [Myxococcota bacterium]